LPLKNNSQLWPDSPSAKVDVELYFIREECYQAGVALSITEIAEIRPGFLCIMSRKQQISSPINRFEITNNVKDNGTRPLGRRIRGLTIPYEQ
jgi:hypothetical protein